MKTFFRNLAAIIVGLAVGSLVNMALVTISGVVIPPPAGADLSTFENLRASIHLFEAKHFLFPFLAHALGTLAGATVAVLLANRRRMRFALAIGTLFLAVGVVNIILLPAPLWFSVADLLLAYLPMAWIAAGSPAPTAWPRAS